MSETSKKLGEHKASIASRLERARAALRVAEEGGAAYRHLLDFHRKQVQDLEDIHAQIEADQQDIGDKED